MDDDIDYILTGDTLIPLSPASGPGLPQEPRAPEGLRGRSSAGRPPRPGRGRRSSPMIIFAALLIVLGLGVCSYPFVSDFLYDRIHQTVVVTYQKAVTRAGDDETKAILEKAQDYNRRLLQKSGAIVELEGEELEEYGQIMVLPGTDIMGYIDIPSLHVHLPIYHGTSDEVLQEGVGHLAGSSFPVEGTGVHAMLTGHTGLASASLFTGLDRLKEGDTFSVTVLRREMRYEVTDISVVLPTEVNGLKIDPERNYCTLVTCTPYGVNTHRLLVRGELREALDVGGPATETGKTFVEKTLEPDAGTLVRFAVPLVALALVLGILLVRHVRKHN